MRLAAEHERWLLEAEQKVLADPYVQTLMREFGARIVPGSIKPIRKTEPCSTKDNSQA
jgi:DNA polymerase-3 subunit gamma/tau